MCDITHSVLEKRRCAVSWKLITKSQVYGCAYSTRGEFRKFVKVYLTKFSDLVIFSKVYPVTNLLQFH